MLDIYNTAELVYNVMKESEYFVSLQTSVVINEEYNVSKSEELIGTAIIWRYKRGVVITEKYNVPVNP